MKSRNRLASALSPYLKQHADNPVDWYPWGEEALQKAKREDKPILLSIGYSACHWCHVMAHESFEDEEIAALMNKLFINIKVDREERPDLDKIYQLAHQLLTGRGGGWPLTVFLTPDEHIPFFAGTYFPKHKHYQMPTFKEVLQSIANAYQQQKAEINKQNQALVAALQQLQPTAIEQGVLINDAPLIKAREEISRDYDANNGGFGGAPKFPHPTLIELLIHYWPHDFAAQQMVENTLTKMANGGIYDQIGGGFYRYSVDAEWQIPHFEKMLYDNAQLLCQYARAYALTKNALYEKILLETGNWVTREMQSPAGGYYATIDADSAGKEGKFYIWSITEVKELLSPEEYNIVAQHFNLTAAANFEQHWHLHVEKPVDEVAKILKLPITTAKKLLTSAQLKLFTARAKRIHPHRDDKIICSWNGLMIKGMALAGMHLQNPEFIDSAERALNFIYNNLWNGENLLAAYKDEQAYLSAYLDDYVFLIDAILTLLTWQWHTEYFNFAQQLAQVVMKHFYDKEQGGFFFVADNHEKLLLRLKTFSDEALPAGNAIAGYVLQRLGYLVGEQQYLAVVEQTLRCAWQELTKYPSAYASLLLVLTEYLQAPRIIIVRCKQQEVSEWRTLILHQANMHNLAFIIANTVNDLPRALAEKSSEKIPVAYICQGFQCLSPIYDSKELMHVLKQS